MARRVVRSGALAGATLAAMVLVGVSGAARPAAGPIRFYAPATDTPTGTIVIAGAVGDYGKALSMDKNGRPNVNGNFVKLTLTKGGFVFDVTQLNKVAAKAAAQIDDPATCSFAFSASGPATAGGGTGLYKGISGTVTVTINFLGDGPRYTSGAKKGQCDQSANAKPLAERGWITGEGTVSFG